MKAHAISIFVLLLASRFAFAGTPPAIQQFVIEREIQGAGAMTPAQLREAAQKSNSVLRVLGPDIQWVHSYVAGDKIYCIYNAPSEALIRSHAEQSGFPANRITRVTAVITPTTANVRDMGEVGFDPGGEGVGGIGESAVAGSR
jgi:hypothetical protein